MQLTSASGEAYTGYALFVCLARSLRLLWPLALATRFPGLGDSRVSRGSDASGE